MFVKRLVLRTSSLKRKWHSLKVVIFRVALLWIKFSSVFLHFKHYERKKPRKHTQRFDSVQQRGGEYNSQESDCTNAKVPERLSSGWEIEFFGFDAVVHTLNGLTFSMCRSDILKALRKEVLLTAKFGIITNPPDTVTKVISHARNLKIDRLEDRATETFIKISKQWGVMRWTMKNMVSNNLLVLLRSLLKYLSQWRVSMHTIYILVISP